MAIPLRALIVEDSEADCFLLARALRQGGYDVQHTRVDSAEALRDCLRLHTWDIVISDHTMPGFSGTAALGIVREALADIPFIFVSGTIGEEVAVRAMKEGAQDYIMKGGLSRLLPAIERELREAERRRDHRNTELRMRQLEKFEAIGKLAGGIAHDFNNVIGAIMGWAELGAGEVPEGSRAAKYFGQIRNHSERAAGLTRQLLSYARRQILEPRNIDLNQVISETTSLLQKVIGDQIEVEINLAQELQSVRADPSQIEQVFMNLCVNARDAMPEGGRLRIETRNVELDEEYCKHHIFGRPGKYVRLSVSDTGTGMSAETVNHIFEPFFTTKEIGKGTGLGLATALGVVNQHGGSIEVLSELGKGTTFHVFMLASEATAEPPKREKEVPVIGGRETILVADDHDGVREMNREVLESLGYRVLLARDGEEALREFQIHQSEISLVILDVVMPKMQGCDSYLNMSKRKSGIPVIFISGYSDPAGGLAPLVAKGAAMLQKPYGPKILARKVREILDRPKK